MRHYWLIGALIGTVIVGLLTKKFDLRGERYLQESDDNSSDVLRVTVNRALKSKK